jgi:hypothetical protein
MLDAVVLVTSNGGHVKVLVELEVVLPALALGVIDFEVAAGLSLFLHLAASAAPSLQRRLDLLSLRWRHRGVGKSADVLAMIPAAANAIASRTNFIFNPPLICTRPHRRAALTRSNM